MTNPLPYRAVILCGGSGSRLWPLSRELLPKQFIRLTDDRSLLQNTLLRLDSAGAQAHHAGVQRSPPLHRGRTGAGAGHQGCRADPGAARPQHRAGHRRRHAARHARRRGPGDAHHALGPCAGGRRGAGHGLCAGLSGGAPGRAGDVRHHPDRAAQRLWLHPGRCARRHGARPARAPLRRKALAGGRAALHRGRQLLLE